MKKHEVVQKLMAEGLPPRGWVRLVIRRADGGYEVSSPITRGTVVPLEAGEEIVAVLDGDLVAQAPHYPEHYGDSDLVEKYLLRVAPEKVDKWRRLYGPATGWDPLTALRRVGVGTDDFLSSPEGEEFLASAEAELIRAVLEEEVGA